MRPRLKPPFPLKAARLFALACLGALLFVFVAPGCGRTSLEPESLDDGGAASCGPSTCPTGCCDANGTCRTGRDVRACGSIGGTCSDCVADGFSLCTTSRVCGREDPKCSPSTCSGCCSVDDGRLRCLSGTAPAGCGSSGAQCSNCVVQGRACDPTARACGSTTCNASNCKGCCVGDKCLPGDVATACGTGGAACDSCATGQGCRAESSGGGKCEGAVACGPTTCAGCCNAAGQCVNGSDTTACGSGGGKCAACSLAQVCVADGLPNARTCQEQTACGPSNCAGCCVGNQCVTATTPQACGIKGEACKACGPNLVCGPGGTCVPASSGCNSLDCPGCCVGDVCAFGNQDNACGSGGALCQNCANQAPARVCQGGSCQPPSCGPDNCKSGCCSGNTCVQGTQDNACGAPGGGACTDCSAKGETCQGRQCVGTCGPGNCDGCCQNNSCVTGIANNSCGSGGVACKNCNAVGSFCNGLVVPRQCNSDQFTCPASYGTCPLGSATPVTQPMQKVCSDANLNTLTTACATGPDAPACVAAFALLPVDCRRCLAPFDQPFEQSAGLYACAASSVDALCRRAMGCATDCDQVSCNKCLPTSENQCYTLVNGSGGQCRSFANAASCANDALAAGQPCSQFSYANFGQWFRAVGDRFCGNGP
jgi:hypothetical protein